MSKLSQFMGGGGGGGAGVGSLPIEIINGDALLEVNISYGIDTSTNPVEVTLPADPSIGDRLVLFDAAQRWAYGNEVIVVLNGDTVQYYKGDLDRFKLINSKGILELVFVGELGWVESSQYETGKRLGWYEQIAGVSALMIEADFNTEYPNWVRVGATIPNVDRKEAVNNLKIGDVLLDTTTSGTYTVTEEGNYLISGASSGSAISRAASGGSFLQGAYSSNETQVYINDISLIRYERTHVNSDKTTSPRHRNDVGTPIITIPLPLTMVYRETEDGVLVVELADRIETRITPVNYPNAPTFVRKGGYLPNRGGNDAVYAYASTHQGGDSASTAMGIYLLVGDVIRMEIGAKITPSVNTNDTFARLGTGRTDAESGRVTIHKLTE